MGIQTMFNFKASPKKNFLFFCFLKLTFKNYLFVKDQWNCDLNSCFFLLNSKSLKSNRIFGIFFKLIRKIKLEFEIIPILKRKFINIHLRYNFDQNYISESKILMNKEIFYEKKVQFIIKSFEPSSVLYPTKSLKKKFPIKFHCAAQKNFILQSLNTEIIQSGKIRVFYNRNADIYRKSAMNILKSGSSKNIKLDCQMNKKRKKYGIKTLFKTTYLPDKRQRDIIVSAKLTVNFFLLEFQRKKTYDNGCKSRILNSKGIAKSILTNVFSFTEFN